MCTRMNVCAYECGKKGYSKARMSYIVTAVYRFYRMYSQLTNSVLTCILYSLCLADQSVGEALIIVMQHDASIQLSHMAMR